MDEKKILTTNYNNSINASSRAPKCTRCRNHGIINDLRGHKHKCYWRDCTCAKCMISSDKQRATADRIALFRQQVRHAVTDDRRRRYSDITDEEDQISPQNLNTPTSLGLSTPPSGVKNQQSPPPLTKLKKKSLSETAYTSISPHEHPTSTTSTWTDKDELHMKNIEILKYIFPFYDTSVLNIISRGCHDDMLQTVLSISSCVLESKRDYPSREFVYNQTGKSCSPTTPLSENGRCCSSPYCPVNSYLSLRMTSPNFPHRPPPIEYHKRVITKVSPEQQQHPPTKKFRFSFEEDTNLKPFCQGCRKYGIYGDKFCPLCGILYQ